MPGKYCFFYVFYVILLLHSPNSSTGVSAASPAPSCSPATARWCGTTTAPLRPLGLRRGTSGRWRPWGTSRRRGQGRGRRSCRRRARTTGGPLLSQVYLDEIFFLKNNNINVCAGGDGTWRDNLSIANILRRFNPHLVGASRGGCFSFVREKNMFSYLLFINKALESLPPPALA